MTYRQAMEYIDSLKSSGMKFGLERISRILRLCGNPEGRLRFVHVAGTNGKGSVCRMIQCILTAAGFKTGLFCSPAVTGLRDTITVDGRPIPKRKFAYLTQKLHALLCDANGADFLSEFEFITALAFLYFKDSHTDVCVIECGLGGKDDATNVIPPPLAAVFTPVSLDHTDVLGGDIGAIAANKCGIIKPPCHVITSPEQHNEALSVIMQRAAELHLTVNMPFLKPALPHTLLPGLTGFKYDNMSISMPVTGEFQIANALTAIETVRMLKRDGFTVSRDSVVSGLAGISMPCRQEVLRRHPLIMVDGAHNPQGVGALATELRRHSIDNLTLVCGMLADKDVSGCMEMLAPFCRRAVCCTPQSPRALAAAALADILKKIKPSMGIEVSDSPENALKAALAAPHAPLLVAGSFYVASALRPLLQKIIKNNVT